MRERGVFPAVMWNATKRFAQPRSENSRKKPDWILLWVPVFAVHSNFHDAENPTVGIWFWGEQTGGTLQAGSDASDVGFFSLDELPQAMAFPTDRIVCKKIKRCLECNDLAMWLASCPAID
jgi:hypothetical protein